MVLLWKKYGVRVNIDRKHEEEYRQVNFQKFRYLVKYGEKHNRKWLNMYILMKVSSDDDKV